MSPGKGQKAQWGSGAQEQGLGTARPPSLGWLVQFCQDSDRGQCSRAWLPDQQCLLPDVVTRVGHSQKTVSTSIHSSQKCKHSSPRCGKGQKIPFKCVRNVAEDVGGSGEPSFLRKQSPGQAAGAEGGSRSRTPRPGPACRLPLGARLPTDH